MIGYRLLPRPEKENGVKRKKTFAFTLLLGLSFVSCASNQVSSHVLSGTERVVELYIPECVG